MRISRSALLVLAVTLGAPVSQAQAPNTYSQLVERLKSGDRTVDFTELRMAFTETDAYNGMMMGIYRQLWNPLNAKDFEGALKVVDAVLLRNYAEPNAHMVASIAHAQLGRQMESQFHRFIADGLLRSIMSQGDGKTQETAYRVIDVSEVCVFPGDEPDAEVARLRRDGEPIVDTMTLIDNRTKEGAFCISRWRIASRWRRNEPPRLRRPADG